MVTFLGSRWSKMSTNLDLSFTSNLPPTPRPRWPRAEAQRRPEPAASLCSSSFLLPWPQPCPLPACRMCGTPGGASFWDAALSWLQRALGGFCSPHEVLSSGSLPVSHDWGAATLWRKEDAVWCPSPATSTGMPSLPSPLPCNLQALLCGPCQPSRKHTAPLWSPVQPS